MALSTKVYVVIGGSDYEGDRFSTLRLFTCESTAEAYKADLSNEYDYALLSRREVYTN